MGTPTIGPDSEAPTPDRQAEPYPGYYEGAPPPDLGCSLPPRPWYCSLPPGHEGPCPTRLRYELEQWAARSYPVLTDSRAQPVLNAYKRVGISISEELTRDTSPQFERELWDVILHGVPWESHLIPAPRPWWLPHSLQTFLLGRLTKTVRCRRG